MPSSFATVKGWTKSILNEGNRNLVNEFVSFMETTDTSENYRRGNLIPVIFFAKYLEGKSLSEVREKSDIIGFLDTKKKDVSIDTDKRWIRTWNDYLQRIKYFMRWLHEQLSCLICHLPLTRDGLHYVVRGRSWSMIKSSSGKSDSVVHTRRDSSKNRRLVQRSLSMISS